MKWPLEKDGGKGVPGIPGGTSDDHQQVNLKEKTCPDKVTPLLLWFLAFTPPAHTLEESVCRGEGFLNAAPFKAAIIITLRG